MFDRNILVDDTSPLISYQGQWNEISKNANPSFTPFNNTLNALQFGSGSFTFNFIGTNVTVAAFINFNSTKTSWTCFIDGNEMQNFNLSNANYSLPICDTSNLNVTTKTTPRNLTVVASGTTDNPFLFDFILYIPDASTILDNATVTVFPDDSQIQYDSSWNTSDATDHVQTSAKGASMTFDFVGIQITWLSESVGAKGSPASTVNSESSALYRIDNGPSNTFAVTIPSDVILWISFQTPILSPGSHRLFVEYNGDNDNLNNSVPLVLGGFIVQNRTIPPNPPNPPNSVGLSGGAIAGVVVGSVVGLVLIFTLIWFIRRPEKVTRPEPHAAVKSSVNEVSFGPGADPELDRVRS